MSSMQTLLALSSINKSSEGFSASKEQSGHLLEEREQFNHILEQTVRNKKESKPSSSEQAKPQEVSKDKNQDSSQDNADHSQSVATVPDDWTAIALLQAQQAALSIRPGSQDNSDGTHRGTKHSRSSFGISASAQGSNSLWATNDNPLFAASSGLGLATANSGTQLKEAQLFAQMIQGLEADHLSNASSRSKGLSSQVSLTGDFNALSTSVMLHQSSTATDVPNAASSMKAVQSVLGEYWVPPVQVQAQSATEATVQMNLKDGGVLTMHLQLGDAKNASLRIEAPAATLAALQSKLAPLQEALLQQGLTLAPVQWGVAKSSLKTVAAVSSEKNTLLHDHSTLMEDGESALVAPTSQLAQAVTAVDELSQ